MIKFEHPYLLLILIVIPIIWGLYIFIAIRRKKQLAKIGDSHIIQRLAPNSGKRGKNLQLSMFLLALLFIIIGVANPLVGTKEKNIKQTGTNIVIALDISNSMLAEDIQPNRLKRAKNAVGQLIDNLEQDKIGIVVFAGNAKSYLPMTNNASTAKMFVNSIETTMISRQGTNISDAIYKSMLSFEPNDNVGKSIIIISDGEDFEQGAIEMAISAADSGIRVHTIGVGAIEGAPIPEYENGIKTGSFKKDQSGNTVITKPNEALLSEIANQANGIFISATSGDIGLQKIVDEIRKGEEGEYSVTKKYEYEDRYILFIFIGLIFLIIATFIPERQLFPKLKKIILK